MVVPVAAAPSLVPRVLLLWVEKPLAGVSVMVVPLRTLSPPVAQMVVVPQPVVAVRVRVRPACKLLVWQLRRWQPSVPLPLDSLLS